MNREHVTEELKEIVLDILEDDDIEDFGEDDDFVEELQMDSLQAVSMLIHIERRFKVTLPQSELEKFKTLRMVVDVVMENLAAKVAVS